MRYLSRSFSKGTLEKEYVNLEDVLNAMFIFKFSGKFLGDPFLVLCLDGSCSIEGY